MNLGKLERWLREYGSAWERKDGPAFVALFSSDVRYYWTPFSEPRAGHAALAEAFESAIARQEKIRFEATVLSVTADQGVAHWSCSFDRRNAGHRVRLDGVFVMDFDADGACRVFREWWHSDEDV